MSSRTYQLDTLSEIVLPNGQVTRKLDFLGIIRVYNRHYFNVWRRYNNVYEIVIEDYMGDFHVHKDYTVRDSIQKILCLSDEQMEGIYTIEAISFKHRNDISEDVTPLRWTEIEHRWYALDINVGGIHQDFHCIRVHQEEDNVSMIEVDGSSNSEEITPTPQWQPLPVPGAPQAAPVVRSVRSTTLRPQNLSDRFAAVESSILSSSQEFTVLRNGTKIPKLTISSPRNTA